MAAHISTKQIIEYAKTHNKISVDGIIYEDIEFTDTSILIGDYDFPLDYFDIGGMDRNSLILVDTSHEYRRVQFHDDDNTTLDHPEWQTEKFDETKRRNGDIAAIANSKPFNK